jgi:hypothetical protein
MRGLIHREMKRLVEFDRARQIRRRLLALRPHRVFGACNRTEIAGVAVQRGLRGGMALDRNPHLGQIAELCG